jgi:hypothetical protein
MIGLHCKPLRYLFQHYSVCAGWNSSPKGICPAAQGWHEVPTLGTGATWKFNPNGVVSGGLCR